MNSVLVQVDLDMLRELAWSGTPADLRPLCWQLLLGYLPPNRDRRYAAATAYVLRRVLCMCEKGVNLGFKGCRRLFGCIPLPFLYQAGSSA